MLPTQRMLRLHGLDYLRGLTAFGIMVYHYYSWTFGELKANSFLGRIGIYGVVIFYVLSGQALGRTYKLDIDILKGNLRAFYTKRFFRIFPLLWVATFLSIAISKRIPNFLDVFLNITGLFGLVRWDVYFATGAWSIGNELTFYLTFPFIVLLANKNRTGLAVFTLTTALVYCYFSFYVLNPNVTLSSQWVVYTNPLNQFAFFLAGTLIGVFGQPTRVKTALSVALGLIGLIVFSLYPMNADATGLVTGASRIVFSSACLLICYSFYSYRRAPKLIDKPLASLGRFSYSLYLLHPLIYAIVKFTLSFLAKIGFALPLFYLLLVALPVSLVVSYLSYEYFEKYFIGQKRDSLQVNPK